MIRTESTTARVDFRWGGALGTFALLALLFSGCSQSDGKVEVSGAVTLDGERMDGGEVLFVPVDSSMPTEAAYPQNGRYTARITPGEKKVVIRWERPHPTKTVAGMEPGTTEPLLVQVIPLKYNEQTELTAGIREQRTESLDFVLEGAVPFG